MTNWAELKGFLLGLLSPRYIDNCHLRQILRKILEKDLSASGQEANAEMVYKFLNKLDQRIARLNGLSYLETSGSAALWRDGVSYAEMARILAQHLHNAGWLKLEEIATALWAKATLQLQSHYHHVVGPAMIAWGSCHERLGNSGRARQIYAVIIADFAWIADKWKSNMAFSENYLSALRCLKVALEKTLSIRTSTENATQLTALLSKVERIEMR